jgi:hypothetical protein
MTVSLIEVGSSTWPLHARNAGVPPHDGGWCGVERLVSSVR